MEPIRVLIADDDPAITDALIHILGGDDALVVVGTAHDSAEAVRIARREHPDVALIDPRIPRAGGARAARDIRADSPDAQVVGYLEGSDPRVVWDMLAAGAVGCLAKGAGAEEICRAMHQAAEGRTVLSGVVANSMVDEVLASRRKHIPHHEAAGEAGAKTRSKARGDADKVRSILAKGAFVMAFQPILHLGLSRTVGVEALARFVASPKRRPDIWFETARVCGYGVELELSTAAAALSRIEYFPPDVYLAVNVSPEAVASLGLLELLDRYDGRRIVLEVTEHAAVEDYGRLRATVKAIRKLGVRLAIDDVGAGFSSMRHVLRLHPDIIKIDSVLSAHITSPAGRALIGGFVSYAEQVGASVVAEGVERREQLDALRATGIQFGQGYLLGRPAHLERPPSARRSA